MFLLGIPLAAISHREPSWPDPSPAGTQPPLTIIAQHV